MIDINDYFYFVKVVEHQGYSRAATALNISKSKISRHVVKLEERLGQRLLQRTSRHFNTTEAGDAFYLRARKVIDAVEAAENAALGSSNQIAGTVTLSSSMGVANFLLKELLTGFNQAYPDVVIRQHVSNDYVDIIPAGFDMVIRGHSSSLPDSSYIQKNMARVEWHLFASPAFLAELHDPIETPADLAGLPTLAFGWQTTDKTWTLQSQQGNTETLSHQPRLCSDDMWTLKHAAEQGGGIVSLPSYVCHQETANNTLVRVLPQWTTAQAQLSILLPSRMGLSNATQTLATYLCDNAPDRV